MTTKDLEIGDYVFLENFCEEYNITQYDKYEIQFLKNFGLIKVIGFNGKTDIYVEFPEGINLDLLKQFYKSHCHIGRETQSYSRNRISKIIKNLQEEEIILCI